MTFQHIDEARATVEFLDACLLDLHAQAESRAFDPDEQTRFDEGMALRKQAAEFVAAYEAREQQLRDLVALNPSVVHHGDDRSAPAMIVRNDPFDLSRITVGGDIRSQALEVVEAVDGLEDRHREETERLVRNLDQTLAARVITTSSPAYRSAFQKVVGGVPELLDNDEREALNAYKRAASLTGNAGGYAVPAPIDPTIIDTGSHSTNPFRQISTVKKITQRYWTGVSSAGVTASWDSEAAEVSDDAPTLAQPQIDTFKGAAFVPFSIEIGGDWANIEADLRAMIQIAKDDLEGAAFVSGNGTSAPQGVTTGLDGTSSEIAPTTAEVFADDDVFKLEGALAARFRRNAVFVANQVWIQAIRAFETTLPVGSLVGRDSNLGEASLLGRPLYESSDMDAVLPNAAATADNFGLLFGDFKQGYYIIDRVGLSVELVPHMFHTGNNRPSGQRGFYAWFRTGAEVVNTSAIVMLSIPTTA